MGATEPDDHAICQLDLLGEIRLDDNGKAYFQRGITEYPVIGDSARLTSPQEMQLVVDVASSKRIMIGHLLQNSSIPVFARAEEMLCKHFAVFGATGVGKSSGVALILQGLLETLPNLRIFLIDPHNEYRNCFEDRAKVLNPRNLKLPFWLFNFEETINVLLRGRSDLNDEVEILSEMIPIAKTLYAQGTPSTRAGARRSDLKSNNYTIDTPVPYRLHDLVGLVDERMGKLENLSMRTRYHRLIARIETVSSDPRYGFMFDNANAGGDTMAEVLGQLFRLPTEGKSVTVMQLAGFPAEVVDPVVSVLCRMAFDFGLWSDGAAPLLVVCEEAHRYAPADRTLGFEPTRRAVSRIAKEGRKYGVYLGLVTQRPAELDPTIISQCSTIFTMRMANDRDQAIVRAAAADAAANQLNFVPALGVGEVIAFGEGVALPIRLKFSQLPEHLIPRAKSVGHTHLDAGVALDKEFTEAVVDRWRGGTSSKKLQAREELDVVEAAAVKNLFSGPENSSISHAPVGYAIAAETSGQPDPNPVQQSQDGRPAILGKIPARGLSGELQELRERLRNRSSQQ
jgi:DNA helicase HerA-like ATPase